VIFPAQTGAGRQHTSFGIHVARMAGMPPASSARGSHPPAAEKNITAGDTYRRSRVTNYPRRKSLSDLDCTYGTFTLIRKLLEEMDINRLTPVEALLKLQEVRNLLNSAGPGLAIWRNFM